MPVHLNHTIISSRDSTTSANFLAEILGLPSPTRYGPFLMVETANGVSLDFTDADAEEEIGPQAPLLGRPRAEGAGEDQPPGRRPRRVFRGSGWSSARDPDTSVRERGRGPEGE